MKGRIIGREGRNIRALEQATGVDLIIDDTPEAVVLSASIRCAARWRAWRSPSSSATAHPSRSHRGDGGQVPCRDRGGDAPGGGAGAYDAGVPGLHPGADQAPRPLKYRTSYGQNVLNHCVETARLSGLLAAEIGANIPSRRRAASSTTSARRSTTRWTGPHALIGGDIAKRYGRQPGGLQLHRRAPPGGGAGVDRGDRGADRGRDQRIAAGARGESLDNYVKRLDDLQQIALAFPGVERCYAIQAGREIRILVRPEEWTTWRPAASPGTSSRRSRSQLQYPGQIKVTVIRETRAVDYAR
jgi:ribonuclease Y